jgi:hypothetical protein
MNLKTTIKTIVGEQGQQQEQLATACLATWNLDQLSELSRKILFCTTHSQTNKRTSRNTRKTSKIHTTRKTADDRPYIATAISHCKRERERHTHTYTHTHTHPREAMIVSMTKTSNTYEIIIEQKSASVRRSQQQSVSQQEESRDRYR